MVLIYKAPLTFEDAKDLERNLLLIDSSEEVTFERTLPSQVLK